MQRRIGRGTKGGAIDETPTGKLMEGMLAAIAQFDNDQRAEKTTLGMEEPLKRGRWTFPAPAGPSPADAEDLFPEGIVFDGEAFRTSVTYLSFRDLERSESELKRAVDLDHHEVELSTFLSP